MSLSYLKENVDYKEVQVIKEGEGDNTKLYISGPFLQGNVKNRNGRTYPTEMLDESVASFLKKKKGVGVPGELNHPPGVEINLDRVSHYVTELKMDGNNGMGKALIASTPKGCIARNLLEDGMQLGVSTRGLGKLTEKGNDKVVSDFDLVTVDIVADPSAPDAYVESIMEGLQYYIDDNQEIHLATKVEEILENMKQRLSTLPRKSEERTRTYFQQINEVLGNL